MRRIFLAVIAAALVVLATMAGTARAADPAIHDKFTVSDEFTVPAGTLCDFTYHIAFTIDVNTTYVPATGMFTYMQTQYVAHTNVDTGYTLTEVDHSQNLVPVPGSGANAIQMGVFWHLRDASGKLVLVKAGQITYDAVTGELIKFTPNSSADQTFAQIICPALGGSPA